MVDAFKKLILRLFTELTSGYHLPRYARVVAVSDPPLAGATSTDFRPYAAVDIAVLDATGAIDTSLPVFPAVPIPVAAIGAEAGAFALPREGTLVVVGFVRGLPNQPFIQCVLPQGATLPAADYGEQLQAHSAECYQRVAGNGDMARRSHGAIDESSLSRTIESVRTNETHQRRAAAIAEHDIEQVGGIKRIVALGALRLLTGGTANIGASGNLNLTTASDINETIGRIKNSIAREKQRLKVNSGGKIWIGDDATNVLTLLSDLCATVQTLANTAAAHTHGGPGPDQAGTFSSAATDAGNTKSSTDDLKE